ncbi:putative toxin-antitoxin system toxin component, PIN family [Aquincola sp. S2]|uniref:Toxin-antitoxin system toxin component, PIN family n=1 Tax=Pseudaquabacterium terrae TaxID=2732868 RepID=A0ABX2EBB4_9BURK|nr:putative toxin-antitoxin system toxin component, PIN family [Aquabacterium terrae]NRF66394.1 putative toxin-antitoxin system toxin component, PIN family [Aquabacterium terrae]
MGQRKLPKSPRLYSWLRCAGKPALEGLLEHAEHPVEVVLDTNVLLDWLLFEDPSAAGLAAALQAGRVQWVATQAMLDELSHVQQKAALQARLQRVDTIAQAVARWCRVVEAPPPLPPPWLICTDADDQKFIDLALARRTPWLLSRDKALLALARRARPRGVVVCRPAAWSPATVADVRT